MSTAHHFWHLSMHPRPVKIARLAPGSAVPQWARGGDPMTSVTWNAKETSVIAPADVVPIGVVQAGPFHAFEIEGPLDFTLTGVLGGLLGPLAQEGVAVITLSTFETDWILIPVDQSGRAATVWRQHGHAVDVVGENDPERQEAAGSGPASAS
ncbi:hypothetical protein KEM60_00557 [Austwickia sp. TVS 96-490-7B]|uniref:ACT domain-containing protein n=1 Tax=Austwickia sp. TVS 96-490-7B TaxID=2830843 RepID=UPI001C5606E8|nr:ACT domain-containing protein [Austwickia sp. TVS 96-490-7B]MBW3084370.1 hypothetical protein [Austwickia sp. TVS 96-490-7B]